MQSAQHAAASLLQTASGALPSKPSNATPLPAPLPITQCRTLWTRMAEIYGHRWTSSYGDEADEAGTAGTWAKGLAGITPQQLAAGLKASIASADPWPPTLPEFRARCLGIPPLAQVRLEIRGEARSRFTLQVWHCLDGHRFGQVSADVADRMLRDAYELAREFVMAGGVLPEKPVALTQEKREPTPATPEQRAAHIARTRAVLGIDGKSSAAGDAEATQTTNTAWEQA